MIFVFIKTLLKLDTRFFFFFFFLEILMSGVEETSHFKTLKASLLVVI